MTQAENGLRSQTASIFLIIVAGGFFLCSILIVHGMMLASQDPKGKIEITIVGHTLKSTNIGFGEIFIGVVLAIVTVRQGLRTFERVAISDQEAEKTTSSV